MKRLIYLGICASFAVLTSCGGGEETTNEGENTDTTKVEEVVEITVMQYNLDTAMSTVNWKAYASTTSEEDFHYGTIGITDGSFEITTENGVSSVSAGDLNISLGSIVSGEGADKLVGHLMAPDFFNTAENTAASFTVTGWEEGSILGTLNLLGVDLNITAPASIDVTEGIATVSVEEFRVDFTPLNMPYFVEDAKKPVEEQHDPKIGINATIVGM